jgi:hypothetical protein
MFDTAELAQIVQKQIEASINTQVAQVLTDDAWLQSIEEKIIAYTQNQVVRRIFAAETPPEILTAIQTSVSQLFDNGRIPGADQYITPEVVARAIEQSAQQSVTGIVNNLSKDSVWLERIEQQINQAVVRRTVAAISSLDVGSVIRDQVNENMQNVRATLLKNFASTGIDDQATTCQLTVMDDTTVVENKLTVKDIDVVGTAVINDLVVKGAINTDNRAWQTLSDHISEKTLEKVTADWTVTLINQVKKQIQDDGINFDSVQVGGETLVDGSILSSKIKDTGIEKLGTLRTLQVTGETKLNNNTVNVLNKRMGINTENPEMALSIWDEEVSIVVGKHKSQQAYIGTNRDQGIAIGVNRIPQIEIGTDGLTTVKKLRVGLHKISHETQVPGYAGTRGDLVFNANPDPETSSVFAWVCLGGHKWKTLRSA